jgi:sialic acid synthase SpsE
MFSEVRIKNRTLGPNHPVFISAEIGVTCNYNMNLTRELIDVVSSSGADAVKLIFWFPEEIMSDTSVVYTYDTTAGKKSVNMFEMLQALQFSFPQWQELKAYADQKEVILFSTVNSPSGIQFAEQLGLEAYKMSSWDFNYHSLWREIARLRKPMIVDSGPVNTMELAKVMNILKEEGEPPCILVHCPHTERPQEMNMLSIPYMRETFNVPTGYSSRGRDSETDIMAVTLGSVYLEKRLTMNRNLPGHHHVISLEPKEFETYVKTMRSVQAAVGVKDLHPSPVDLSERKRWFRHLVANRDLPMGTELGQGMLEAKRPEEGVCPEYLPFFLGRVLKKSLKYNEAIGWDDV